MKMSHKEHYIKINNVPNTILKNVATSPDFFFCFCLGASGAAFAYYKITGGFPTVEQSPEKPVSSNAKDTSFLDALKKKNLKINVAVFGVDGDGTRTDVMFVVHFDSEKQILLWYLLA